MKTYKQTPKDTKRCSRRRKQDGKVTVYFGISEGEAPRCSTLGRIQVLGRIKYRQRMDVQGFTSERDERLEMLVSSRMRDLATKGRSESKRQVSSGAAGGLDCEGCK